MKVIQHGMGYMGQRAVQMMLRKGIEVVGAIDSNKEYVGRDLGDILGMGKKHGVKVAEDIPGVLKNVKADIATNATVTYLEKLVPEMNLFLDAGMNYASISEELAYPWIKYPKLAKELDERAKKNKVTVVGTGVNPGLDMDLVPLIYAGACWSISKIKVQRVVDSSVYSPTRGTKRFGISPAEFTKGVKQKKIPVHTGHYESVTMMADALGWKLDNIYECWEPLVSHKVRETKWFTVQPGTTCGYKQRALGVMRGEVKIELELYFMILPDPAEDGVSAGDTIWIDGEPSICIKATGGPTARGDLVTSGKLVNLIPATIAARPGLLSVKDLPVTPPLPDKE